MCYEAEIYIENFSKTRFLKKFKIMKGLFSFLKVEVEGENIGIQVAETVAA